MSHAASFARLLGAPDCSFAHFEQARDFEYRAAFADT